MGEMLTQEEINALLSGGDSDSSDDTEQTAPDVEADTGSASPEADFESALTPEQKDILGEIGNISMGTAATTLFTLLNSQKVLITTPKVTVMDWDTLSRGYDRPCVGVKVNYTEGLLGSNVLMLKENDVRIMTDLMMGGEGLVDSTSPLSELEVSAIGEAMNQMVGSSSTSMSSVLNRKIDIDTPQAFLINFGDDSFFEQTGFAASDILACISFRMEIGTLIDSEIMQILPIEFALDIVNKMMGDLLAGSSGDPAALEEAAKPPPPQAAAPAPYQEAPPQGAPPAYAPAPPPAYYAPAEQGVPAYAPPPQGYAPPPQGYAPPPQGYAPPPGYAAPGYGQPAYGPPPVNAQPASFESLDITELAQQKENIGIIMDVPLEITVELGRTSRKIREILEFAPGTIVDLDKIAGEPIDILVNGKYVASGEVVVVDENFAVRVTDILSVDKRI